MIRPSTAKQTFYPANSKKLEETLQECFIEANGHDFQTSKPSKINKNIGGVVPHAGYKYSCSIAAKTYQKLMANMIPDTVIILGFQHQNQDPSINAVMSQGSWETPLGHMQIDTQIAKEIGDYIPIVDDPNTFINPSDNEHSIEVQLPYLQYIAKKSKKSIQFVPISVNSRKEETIDKIGTAIADVIEKYPEKKIQIIATTDMSHERPRDPIQPAMDLEIQRDKDQEFITIFEQKNWKKLLEKGRFSTICGPQTMATLLNAGKKLGYRDIKSLDYATSCEQVKQPICEYSVGYYAGVVENDM